ncbi:MAG: glycosyl hydrolase family 4 [Thermus sp.]|uniref:family 4 glycosyl hydrolase n=1 Tax=Thermus sp. TaxID=275 RepID=UPI00391B5A59
MSLAITLVGAGSAVFTRSLVTDLLLSPLEDLELRLVDPDGDRLQKVLRWVGLALENHPKKGFRALPMPLEEALRGSRVAILTADMGGDEALRRDHEIALRYGILETIGDTLGPGGLFKFLRNAPLVDRVASLFQGELVLNHMNPLSPLTALLWERGQRALGLCHSIPESAKTLASYLGVDPGDLAYRAAGVNHLSWFLELREGEEDLYPRLREVAQGPVRKRDPVRFELMEHFGLFPSESSAHASEYTPYFRKDPATLRRYFPQGAPGDTGYYVQTHPHFVRESLRSLEEGWTGQRSGEYGVRVLEAYFLGREEEVYATVPNPGGAVVRGLLEGPVETAVRVGKGTLEALPASLPYGPAVLSRRVQEVHLGYLYAYLEGDPQLAEMALALDPLVGAVLDLPRIRSLFRELLLANPGVWER